MLHCYKSRSFHRETAHWGYQEPKDDHVCPDHTTPPRLYTSPKLAILYVVVEDIQLIVLRRPFLASKFCFSIPLALRWEQKITHPYAEESHKLAILALLIACLDVIHIVRFSALFDDIKIDPFAFFIRLEIKTKLLMHLYNLRATTSSIFL